MMATIIQEAVTLVLLNQLRRDRWELTDQEGHDIRVAGSAAVYAKYAPQFDRLNRLIAGLEELQESYL